MALQIGTASQKGGVSKSSIARNLAVTFAMNSWEAKIMDIDLDQSTCQGWSLRRMAAGFEPIIRVDTFQNFTQAQRAAERDGADVFIFDGPRRFSRYLSRQPSNYAASFSTISSCSGFSITVPIGFQLRV